MNSLSAPESHMDYRSNVNVKIKIDCCFIYSGSGFQQIKSAEANSPPWWPPIIMIIKAKRFKFTTPISQKWQKELKGVGVPYVSIQELDYCI